MTFQVLDSGKLRNATPEEAAEIVARQQQAQEPPVPDEVTRRQGYLALFDAGVTEAMIEAKMAELLNGAALERALLDRQTASTFRRDNPLVQLVGEAFGLDLDALFLNAADPALGRP
jgi:hypothetical protein